MAGTQLRTPLGRARGMGAAKSGTTDWIAQRISAIALAPLAGWLVLSSAASMDGSYESALAWLSTPLNAVLMLLLSLAAFYHMGAGMRVIVEDYIHRSWTKAVLLLLNVFVWVSLAAASIYAILKVSLGN